MQVVSILNMAGLPADGYLLRKAINAIDRGLPPLQGQSLDDEDKASVSNEYIERFKFWIGLPNNYYATN